MLILTRRPGESIQIGEEVTVRVLAVNGSQICIGVEAPKETNIVRTELLDKPKKPGA